MNSTYTIKTLVRDFGLASALACAAMWVGVAFAHKERMSKALDDELLTVDCNKIVLGGNIPFSDEMAPVEPGSVFYKGRYYDAMTVVDIGSSNEAPFYLNFGSSPQEPPERVQYNPKRITGITSSNGTVNKTVWRDPSVCPTFK